MNVAPRRFVKPLAPPVVARREEVPALSEISNIEVSTRFRPPPWDDLLLLLRPAVLVFRRPHDGTPVPIPIFPSWLPCGAP